MSIPHEQLTDPIDLEIIDHAEAVQALLALEAVTYVSVEGDAVPQLRREFAASVVERRVPEAALFSALFSKVATFRKSGALVERIVPILAGSDHSITQLNLHDDSTKLVEGYDWGMGCCPVSLAGSLYAVATRLIEEGAARRWPDDED